MVCPYDALGVELSVQDEGLRGTGVLRGVCTCLWIPLVLSVIHHAINKVNEVNNIMP